MHSSSSNTLTLPSSKQRRHRNSILNRFLLKTSFHFLLSFTFVTFLIHWTLFPAASSISWCQSCFVCSGLTYEIYSGGGPSTFIYCVVCYHVIVAPYVRSVGHVFAYLTLLMTIRNALWTMRLLYSLKIFLYILIGHCTSLSPWFIILDKNNFVKLSHH